MTEEDSREGSVSPEEAEYFRSIEERFCALRGASRLLSPRDWNLIAGWWTERIPLSLVLESLEEVFLARRRGGTEADRVNSLAYLRPELIRRWRLRREMTAPRRGEDEEAQRLRLDLRRHLGRVARGLKVGASEARGREREELARTLLEAAGEVRMIRERAAAPDWSPLECEESLERLDAEILNVAEAALHESERTRLDREALETLTPLREGMRRSAFQETLSAMRARLIRREFHLPRLSLAGEG